MFVNASMLMNATYVYSDFGFNPLIPEFDLALARVFRRKAVDFKSVNCITHIIYKLESRKIEHIFL